MSLNNEIHENKDAVKTKRTRIIYPPLKQYYCPDNEIIEIATDEVGRGPMFGRVYSAAVILPKNDTYFDHSLMKDSKRFSSKKKIKEVSEYIKENAICWSIQYEDEKTIDKFNILQATYMAMHSALLDVKKKYDDIYKQQNNTIDDMIIENYLLLVDGDKFKPIVLLDKKTSMLKTIPFECIKSGDNTYSSIAAASIIAKVERDEYIENLCLLNPELDEKYSILGNKGYGAKKHIEGIKKHGITKWHRKTFGICKTF